jgi:hypothetical protein
MLYYCDTLLLSKLFKVKWINRYAVLLVVKFRWNNILHLTIGTESLLEVSYDNGMILMKFSMSCHVVMYMGTLGLLPMG